MPRTPSRSRSRRDRAATAGFVERFAGALVDGGMPRMPARVFAVLLAEDDGSSTAAHLAELLQASPAAISGAVRYLLHTRMIARERRAGERHDTYRLYHDGWFELLYNREPEARRWAAIAREGAAAVGRGSPASARLEETADFFEFLYREMAGLLERWREQQVRR